jgi:nucleotide-binding universal stress UspA family protein
VTAQRTAIEIRPPAIPAPSVAGPGPPRRILCAIDFSPSSLAVVGQAVQLARACGGEVRVLFIVPYATPSRADPRRLPQGIDDAVSEDLAELLAPARAAGIPIRACLKVGTPAHEILQEIVRTAPDIVVIGTHGRHGVARRLLGSVAAEVLRGASCPVLTVAAARRREEPPRPREGVLCAVALDDSSPRTVAYAAELARATGGRLTLLHVERLATADAVESARRLRALAGSVEELAPGAEQAIAVGEPAHQIVRAAARRNALLVVIGAGADRVPGHVAQRVIRAAPCPVVSVRAAGPGSP